MSRLAALTTTFSDAEIRFTAQVLQSVLEARDALAFAPVSAARVALILRTMAEDLEATLAKKARAEGLAKTPEELEDARRAFEAQKPLDDRAARYTTDDRDMPDRNVLEIFHGGNGDWYVATAPEGQGTAGRGVRICTSGGAQQHAPGLAGAMARAFKAILHVADEPGAPRGTP